MEDQLLLRMPISWTACRANEGVCAMHACMHVCVIGGQGRKVK